MLSPTASNSFEKSRLQDFNALMDGRVFTVVSLSDKVNVRIYGLQFVETIKKAGKPDAFEKSRILVQAFSDKRHGLFN